MKLVAILDETKNTSKSKLTASKRSTAEPIVAEHSQPQSASVSKKLSAKSALAIRAKGKLLIMNPNVFVTMPFENPRLNALQRGLKA